MKVSSQKKRETRQKLVNAAADLFVLQGFDNTSMKQIAREAGVGDATIYKYFPSKDKLILGFYEVRGEDALTSYHNTEDLDEYDFREKFQLLVDTFLEALMADREFVDITLQQFFKSPVILLKDQLSITQAYREVFLQLLNECEASEDFPDIPMKGMLASLFTDYLFGITVYWMKDQSEEFADTNQLIDLSLSLIEALLKSDLINKAIEVFGFMVKTHLLRTFSQGGGLISLLQGFKSNMQAFQEQQTGDQEKEEK